ncbi:unnamed protein product [Calypogeia fissa]
MEKEIVAQDLFKGRGTIGGVEGTREMRYLAQTYDIKTCDIGASEAFSNVDGRGEAPTARVRATPTSIRGGGSCDYNRWQQRSSRIT